MGRDEAVSPRLAVGVGCRKGCAAETIVALVRDALVRAGAAGSAPPLFTIEDKRGEPGLAEAAAELGLPLAFLPRQALAAAAEGCATRSERVQAMFGVPSVAEAAALAGAGPEARLLVPRLAARGATCAIASTGRLP